ncbi:MAG: ABC transporter ATP-binding protein [Leptospirales bacterium]|nr:ABC transporter ATP-binding protein [Leptospirales bacterium]
MTKLALSARSVVKQFGKLRAVDRFDLEIEGGQFVALLGPNGAGKTTFVEMLEGLQSPDQGKIEIFGLDWRRSAARIRRRIGVALQETRFQDRLTVAEILNLFASFYGLGRSRVDQLLEQVQLSEKRAARVAHLSGGQRQRLALATALINEPECLLLDEPTTGLDPNARRDVWGILEGLKARGITLILTTHYMEEAERLCDRIVIMDRGRKLADGERESLLRSLGGEVIEFNSTLRPQRFQQTPGLTRAEALNGRRIRLTVRSAHKALPAILRLLPPARQSDLVCRRMHLDDLFTAMTGRSLDDTTNTAAD